MMPGWSCSGVKLTEDSVRGGEPRHVAADDVFDEMRRLAIGPVDHAGPEHLRPRRIGGGVASAAFATRVPKRAPAAAPR